LPAESSRSQIVEDDDRDQHSMTYQ